MTRTARTATIVAACLLLTVGCSTRDEGAAPTAPTPPTTASATPAPAMDAAAVLAALTAAGLPITNGAVQDADTDPNRLLGRAGGYTSRASFDVPGGSVDADVHSIDRGGVIEVWASAADAVVRAGHIAGLLKANGLGGEYQYLRGPVRIAGLVPAATARRFEVAVAALP